MSIISIAGVVCCLIGLLVLLLAAFGIAFAIVESVEAAVRQWRLRRQGAVRGALRLEEELDSSLARIQAAFWRAQRDLRGNDEGGMGSGQTP